MDRQNVLIEQISVFRRPSVQRAIYLSAIFLLMFSLIGMLLGGDIVRFTLTGSPYRDYIPFNLREKVNNLDDEIRILSVLVAIASSFLIAIYTVARFLYVERTPVESLVQDASAPTPSQTIPDVGEREAQESRKQPADTSTILDTYSDDKIRLALIIDRVQFQSRVRLSEALQRQQNATNINLGVGAITALSGLVFLGYVSFKLYDEYESLVSMYKFGIDTASYLLMLAFAGKLALSFAIQGVAFFFLVLYRSGLGEIRYLENEITNIDMRLIGHVSALFASDDSPSLTNSINSLSSTERNFVLKKRANDY